MTAVTTGNLFVGRSYEESSRFSLCFACTDPLSLRRKHHDYSRWIITVSGVFRISEMRGSRCALNNSLSIERIPSRRTDSPSDGQIISRPPSLLFVRRRRKGFTKSPRSLYVYLFQLLNYLNDFHCNLWICCATGGLSNLIYCNQLVRREWHQHHVLKVLLCYVTKTWRVLPFFKFILFFRNIK